MKQTQKLTALLTAGISFFTLANSAHGQNLLFNNTSFESTLTYVDTAGAGTINSIPGWTLTLGPSFAFAGTAGDQPGTTGRDGSNFGYLNNGSAIETRADARAEVLPATLYTLSVLGEADSGTSDVAVTASIVWYDGSGMVISQNNQAFTMTDTSAFKPYSFNATAPAGAAGAAAKVSVENDKTVIFDKVSLTATNPPPSNVVLNSSGLTSFGVVTPPDFNLSSLGTSDWLVFNRGGDPLVPTNFDRKSGGTGLNFISTTGLIGGGDGQYFNFTWTDGTNTPDNTGAPYGGYWMFNQNNSATFTLSASIAAGATSTINLYCVGASNNNDIILQIRESNNNPLANLPLAPYVNDGRFRFTANFTATSADVVTFKFIIPGGTDSLFAMPAITLSTISPPANPYIAWTQFYNLAGDDALIGSDPDKDGFTNLNEYAFGSNPTTSTPALTTIRRTGSTATITYTERNNGVTYAVKSSETLVPPWINATGITFVGSVDQTGVLAGYTRKQFTTEATGRKFFRMEAAIVP